MNRESVTNLFIAKLSFGDILVIGFALPFRVSEIFIYSFLFTDYSHVITTNFEIILRIRQYRHRHTHKCLCTDARFCLSGICRLMKDIKQQVELTCLLRMTWPKDAMIKETTLTYNVQFGQFLIKTMNLYLSLLVSGRTFCK